jgi:phosphopantothenoylcysteine decarboxylase
MPCTPPDDPTRRNVLLGVTGSVAAIKAKEIYEGLCTRYNVRIVATGSALKFLRTIDGFDPAIVFRDDDEWDEWKRVGDAVLHIDLRRWADVLVIAPLSANSLAKIANGLCDNLLTCIVRAWDYRNPLLVAPAMNTMMWENPVTKKHLDTCEELGCREVIGPIHKTLACGDVGVGAMAEPTEILACVERHISFM